MFFIKNCYLVCCYFIFACQFISLIIAVVKHTKLSLAVSKVIIASFLSIFSFVVTLLTRNIQIGSLAYSFYFAFLDFSIYIILTLEYEFNNQKFIKDSRKWLRIVLPLIVLLDVVSLISNNWTHWMFTARPFYINDKFFNFTIDFTKYFHVHLILCYVLTFFVVLKFRKDLKKASKFYKPRYVVVLVLFLIEISLNALYIGFCSTVKIDYSLIIYGAFSIAVFIFTIYTVPANIKRNILSTTSETVSDGILCFDNKNVCIYKNLKAREIFPDGDFSVLDEYFSQVKSYIQNNKIIQIDDNPHTFTIEFRRVTDKKGRISGSYFILNDRTEELKNIAREEYRSTHDELTGLYNRSYFFIEMERILKEHPEVPRYIIATDIADFKLVNDLFGVKFGDNLLREQARLLDFANFPECIHGRISGDKFAMLIRKQDFNPKKAIENTRKICDFAKQMNFQINVYLGLYEIANPYENVHTMYDKANLAIRNINEDFNTILRVYDTALMKKLMIEKNIVGEFKYALTSKQFLMFLQPQVDSRTGKCVGAEALVRWYDIDKGYRQPGEFIPVLESSGLIYELDYYIWDKAAQQLQEWKKAGKENFYISVNISPKDFYYANLYSVFTKLVEKYDIPPQRLNLEITESVIFDNDSFHKNILTQLKNYGFHIEMDDFGSGYSSLSALKALDMDVIKIDMEFLHQTANEDRGKKIILAIVQMAQKLGMKIITEGVENSQQVDFLTSIGVDLFQGYYYSKPIAVREFEHKYLEVE